MGEAQPFPGPYMCPCRGFGTPEWAAGDLRLVSCFWPHLHPGTLLRPVASSCFVRPLALWSPVSWADPGTLEGQLGSRALGWGPDHSWALGSSVPSPQSPLGPCEVSWPSSLPEQHSS